ncbi:dienelactone hydrolase family protein [Methylibium sp.]|uniref:dienelactone hydrolase family protein n=1 Tax=Methylibium sp. TaxID=2067992 RepID=UPI00286A0E25|nr:dienelactone hydrolase family protein [Methylibium sp.]
MKLMQYGLKPIDFANPKSAPEPQGLSRRGFVVTSLASGFAVASNPVLAQAITTDTQGLTAGEISIVVADGKIPGYRAMPAKRGQYPVVLVVQEIFGVHEHIKDMCRRFAKLGYYAIAPELFARQGDVAKMTDIGAILSQVVSKVPDAQVSSDLDATVAFAKASGSANTRKLGVVGYCWGGRAAWIYARHNPKVKAAVAYYGLLDGMKSDIKPQDPVDFASEIKVPVLGLYAGIDDFVKPAVIEQMRNGIAKSGSGSEIVVFPGVNHGFNADYRPTYDKTAATYAAKLTRDWLKDHGV